ncbi:MAG: hypothetical protein ABL897_08390 [Hyphomicrobium sp.]
MPDDTRTARIAATATGSIILAASAYAVITAGHQDTPHAILTGSLALGVLAGAATLGRVWSAKRYALAAGIAVALFCGEAFNLAATADRIVGEREAEQAKHRTALGGHRYALRELSDAKARKADADKARITEAAKTGCKANCVAMLAAAVETARLDLDKAETLYAANREPTASPSALADRLGVAPWVVDLGIAAMLSIGANGLAAALIAFGTHGQQAPAQAVKLPVDPKPRRNSRKGRKADPNVVSFMAAFQRRHGRKPSPNELRAQFPQMPTTTRYRYARAA